nr:putative serine protease 47 [Bubalus bubalis]
METPAESEKGVNCPRSHGTTTSAYKSSSLRHGGLHVFGAILINSSRLLSTAYCFLKKSKAPGNYRVLLGSTQLYQHTQHTWEVSGIRIITHPDFEKLHPFGSDSAMLQLLFPVNFTSYIIPACLPVPGMKLPSDSSCWITGWGMLNEEKLEYFCTPEDYTQMPVNLCSFSWSKQPGMQLLDHMMEELILCENLGMWDKHMQIYPDSYSYAYDCLQSPNCERHEELKIFK